MKRFLSTVLILSLFLALAVPALGVSEGQERVALGADLTQEQIQTVYSQFGLVRGSVPELTVTNAEERDYLEGLVDESVIGHNAISCVYIRILGANAGLNVTTSNIDWCTEDMYKAALMTAGIYDAQVKVGAPFGVSGTAALTGIYKAYESITGTQLQQEAKDAAADELVTTAQLADQIDDLDAVAIVNELKLLLDETKSMSDEDLKSQVSSIAGRYGYDLSDETMDRLVSLCRTLEGLSTNELQEKVRQFKGALSTVAQYAEKAASFGGKITGLFQKAVDFVTGLFHKD